MTSNTDVPAGWYPDPHDPAGRRYWDGSEWTHHVAAPAAPAPAPAPVAVAVAPPASFNDPRFTTAATQPYTQFAGASLGPGPSQRNVVGIIALVVAVIGFVFACIPGALILGWILLPIAFVLSIIGLFLRGRTKWAAITALIVTIVGTVVGFMVFFTVVAVSFENAFGGGDASVIAPDSSGAAGTRDSPAPFGSAVESDDWTVTLTAMNPNASADVEAANSFNADPGEGQQYVVIDVSATYKGEDEGHSANVQIDYVTSDGSVVSSWDSLVVGIDPKFGQASLYAGASDSGRLVFLVPSSVDGLIRITPGMFADEVFVGLP